MKRRKRWESNETSNFGSFSSLVGTAYRCFLRCDEHDIYSLDRYGEILRTGGFRMMHDLLIWPPSEIARLREMGNSRLKRTGVWLFSKYKKLEFVSVQLLTMQT
uniref:Uncharacterized protein n=1 Tax=Corethron hystrix TaxID=216773 RepID=A0A6U5DL04_9STRA|mmetsp:Transcript_12448/g.27413  ORF Transcript_12448/g.27413 Transcript_12448/m.27413 type:complete len:104 (+) Transcript_12448:266-577(+)